MEHVICKEICLHLSANSAIYRDQHGFRKDLSCETQLVSVIHEWANVLNSHGQVDVVFLDFAKVCKGI